MDEELQILDKYLSTLRPEYYSQLELSLNDAEIDELEKQFDLKLPADLRLLYQWKDGQNARCFEAFVNNSMFVPLREALETAQEYTAMIGADFEIENWWNAKWIPLFHNGGGDYICYDAGGIFTGQRGQLVEFWHADNDRNIIAPNLETFIFAVNSYYAKTSVQDFDKYFEIENIEGFPKEFVVD